MSQPSNPFPTHSFPLPAGTRAGITAAQLDVKLPGGVPLEVVEEAVRAAARGRAQLLAIMEQALPKVGGQCTCDRVADALLSCGTWAASCRAMPR